MYFAYLLLVVISVIAGCSDRRSGGQCGDRLHSEGNTVKDLEEPERYPPITLILDLKVLGLEVCADTLVGDEMLRGISGGQKKRVTTGNRLYLSIVKIKEYQCSFAQKFELIQH